MFKLLLMYIYIYMLSAYSNSFSCTLKRLSTYSCTTLENHRNSEFRTGNATEFLETLPFGIT
jgi:hypothetical protein